MCNVIIIRRIICIDGVDMAYNHRLDNPGICNTPVLKMK